MIEAIARSSAGLDVHKKMVMCTLLREDSRGDLVKETREVPTFRRHLEQLADWLKDAEVELSVMESTGVYDAYGHSHVFTISSDPSP